MSSNTKHSIELGRINSVECNGVINRFHCLTVSEEFFADWVLLKWIKTGRVLIKKKNSQFFLYLLLYRLVCKVIHLCKVLQIKCTYTLFDGLTDNACSYFISTRFVRILKTLENPWISRVWFQGLECTWNWFSVLDFLWTMLKKITFISFKVDEGQWKQMFRTLLGSKKNIWMIVTSTTIPRCPDPSLKNWDWDLNHFRQTGLCG